MKGFIGLGCVLFFVSLLPSAVSPVVAQEKMVVSSKGTFTWDELLQLEKQRSKILEGPSVIHAPLPGPGP